MGVLRPSREPSCGSSVLPGRASWVLAPLVFVGAVILYTATAAPGTLFGDPAEYQFIPAIWGIAHPPGYAVYTLLAGVWQRVVAIGSLAYRTNLLAAVAGAWAASRVAAVVLIVQRGVTSLAAESSAPSSGVSVREGWSGRRAILSAVTAGFAVALMPDLWQHSVHANAHVVSAAITATQLWLLVCWNERASPGWLFALAFLVGIGVAHHPITVWGIPAYLVFIVLRRPRILKDVRIMVGGVLVTAVGLLPWLYFPLRSPGTPFGPTDMNTLDGFLRHATAQGLRVNLFHFGLAEQGHRLTVFVTLLRLQYGWPLLAVMLLGLVSLAVTRPRLSVLWGTYLFGHLVFTMNSVQDVMAYLLHPFVALGVPLGLGIAATLKTLREVGRPWRLGAGAALLVMLLGRGYELFPRVSLRSWQDADAFVHELRERFGGRGQGAVLVSDWEHLTPYFYATLAENTPFARADLRPVYVTGATPWVESVMANLASGPVYLTNYRRDVRQLGFRLRPEGSLWRVLEPPAIEEGALQTSLGADWGGGQLEFVGYDLPLRSVPQGAILPVTLYARVPMSTSAILMPLVRLGTIEQAWTTDSRRLTFEWVPGEIIAEQYRLYVPFDLAPGSYPLGLGYDELGVERRSLLLLDGADTLSLGTIDVTVAQGTARPSRVVRRSLTNVGNQVALLSARARAGLSVRHALWERPLPVRPGQSLNLQLTWQVLARPETSYTVFIHVVDAQGNLWLGHDYTPLGGAFPSYLWFPKWLEGQRVADPYRLVLPAATPEGIYTVEVGIYEMGSIRRVAQLDTDGVMVGDRLILGQLQVVR